MQKIDTIETLRYVQKELIYYLCELNRLSKMHRETLPSCGGMNRKDRIEQVKTYIDYLCSLPIDIKPC